MSLASVWVGSCGFFIPLILVGQGEVSPRVPASVWVGSCG